jgi:hypothetical protein
MAAAAPSEGVGAFLCFLRSVRLARWRGLLHRLAPVFDRVEQARRKVARRTAVMNTMRVD